MSISSGTVDPLAGAYRGSYWHDLHRVGATTDPLSTSATADLVVVGAGFTGLWTAIEAKRRDPSRDVVLLDSEFVGYGATGRNGGFISDSVTHGLSHGLALWPEEIDSLLALGRENLAALAADVRQEGIEADLRLIGKTIVATSDAQAATFAPLAESLVEHGESATLLDAAQVRADVDSPTYLAGIRVRSGGGLLDPIALALGLRDWALRLGVRLHEQTPVQAIEQGAVVTPGGPLRTRQVVLATNAFRNPVRRLRKYVVPVYDHVLVTEPLDAEQWASIGWDERQGLTDAGNQFHYYRPLPDGRILWGGYDAIYYYGSRTDAALEQRDASHRLLAAQFKETFPQLGDIAFTHRWAGLIDTTSRFTPFVGTDRSGDVAHALGFTGLGVAFSRLAAAAALDALEGERVPEFLSERPVPFPPEPIRYLGVQMTRGALAREDRTGKRGALLRTLDRFGVGFNS
ncbi:NAD(P)/FAD-dependent oxidoreductase [Nocardioides sp. GXZ039]|uniref:NAD(P)/FAD-dependent oxidoreductase n=1 Tax=Nocardioides sp. GXZ039 TaxID=3136018 RepID=UPI0030F47308